MLARAYLPLARLKPIQQTTLRRTISSTPTRLKLPQEGKLRERFLGTNGKYQDPHHIRRYASDPYEKPLRQVPRANGEDIRVDESKAPRIPSFERPAYEEELEQTQAPPSGRPERTSRSRVESDASRPQTGESATANNADPEVVEPQGPLPDITKGIPSTLAAELERAESKNRAHRSSLNITEDPNEELPEREGGGPTDRIPRSEYVSSSDRKKRVGALGFYIFLATAITGYTIYLGRNWENEDLEKQHTETAPSGWGAMLFWNRVKARWNSNVSYYSDPVTTTLLPDEEKDPAMRMPFTLVLSLDDLMVHSEWTRSSGWRIAKRPGLDYFLRYLSQYYELVLFTTQPFASGEQVMRKLDPYMMIRWPLYREATLYKDGDYVKDLSYLNRDLKKVIIIDTNAQHVRHQPENAIILPPWKGDPRDQTLIQLIPFLEYLANMGFDDARKVLKSFEGKSIPEEFARREKLLREKYAAEHPSKNKPKRSFGLGSVFKSQDPNALPSLEEAQAEGKMIWDVIRERGQRNYLELEKRIKEEGEKFLADREAEEKRMNEEAMKDFQKGGFLSRWMGGSEQAK